MSTIGKIGFAVLIVHVVVFVVRGICAVLDFLKGLSYCRFHMLRYGNRKYDYEL